MRLPICSFSIKAKIPSLSRVAIKPKTLGQYIRKTRLERGIPQHILAKEIGANSVYLSKWELNHPPVHPKYFNVLIDFLGFIPKLKSTYDRLGTRTQLWRMENKVSLNKFAEILNVQKEEIQRIEQVQHCKIDSQTETKINRFIKKKPISS